MLRILATELDRSGGAGRPTKTKRRPTLRWSAVPVCGGAGALPARAPPGFPVRRCLWTAMWIDFDLGWSTSVGSASPSTGRRAG